MKDCVIVVSLDPGKDKDPSLFFLRVLFACTFLSPDYVYMRERMFSLLFVCMCAREGLV